MKLYTNGQIIQPSEVDFLELEGYEVVKSYSKLNGSNWFKYNAKQTAFYEENSNATPLEVYNMRIEVYEPTLEDVKKQKIAEIDAYDQSDAVNGFVMNGQQSWINKETRVGLRNSTELEKLMGRKESVMWLDGHRFILPCNVALEMLMKLEVYAKDCFDRTEAHKAAVEALESKAAVEVYDYRVGYPEMIVFLVES